MNVLMELTNIIFIHFCELLLMFVSCVKNIYRQYATIAPMAMKETKSNPA